MPLRDHFHKPLSDQTPWESIHAGWPMEIVRQLFGRLPKHYRATPSRKLSGGFEIDIAYLRSATFDGGDDTAEDGWNGTATATLTKLKPSVSVSADLTKPDEVEILVYDGAGELVAAVELVSPANKDRPASREEFVAKAAGLLRPRRPTPPPCVAAGGRSRSTAGHTPSPSACRCRPCPSGSPPTSPLVCRSKRATKKLVGSCGWRKSRCGRRRGVRGGLGETRAERRTATRCRWWRCRTPGPPASG
jgi:hypothetical protein